jgi:hypothetical protein
VSLAAAAPAARDGFHTDLRLALQIADRALVPKTRQSRASVFALWTTFCHDHGQQPSLCDVPLPETRLSYLLVFGLRIRRRLSSQTGKSVRSGTVEDALLAVGQGITALGFPDPRKQAPGSSRNHPLLASFLQALSAEDDPSTRSYPVNVTILRHLLLSAAAAVADPTQRHLADLCIVAFFWLLRPGEYLLTSSAGRSEAFRLCDIAFLIAGRLIPATAASLHDLSELHIERAYLTFNDQKNAVRGEQISHAPTNDPDLCPCKALARLCLHLQSHGADSLTPISAVFDPHGIRHHATPALVTQALRRSATTLQSSTGIDPRLISARSLRPGGATALLCAGVEPDLIQLLGRWKSDAMLRYLRIAAHAHTTNFAQCMLAAGAYTFAPGTYTTATHQPLPRETPAAFLASLQHEDLYHS